MIKLLVSIVNYNSYDDTISLVNNIIRTIDRLGYSIDFFIVDNSSNTEGLENFREKLSQLLNFNYVNDNSDLNIGSNHIYASTNDGFGAANNIVLDYAESSDYYDVIWLLNNDLSLDINVLSALLPYMANDDLKILGSTIYEDHGTVTGTVNMSGFKGYGSPKNIELLGEAYPVDAVIGTSMFIKTKFIKGHRFDERLFMYVEENDFCYRLKSEGITSYMVKSSKVFHEGGKTFGNHQAVRWYYKTRNLLFFKSKNNDGVVLLSLYLFFVTVKNYSFHFGFIKAYLFGVWDFFGGRLGRTKREFK
ncbi:MAG: glycosyltransferase family 2 protein [Gammaproteobacteria bacterium]|nr:glycosyltransferase family 2 protein [Gammaproteobacteria bacterium]